ncbi:MAG: histidinol phosphate phosphatase domain-containing protein [Candidatus Omnitrophica bacterium]|nr:histidinol phosphate phosphatase domain-containing protein [Candidatus Omnitrophota bacterium]MCG2703585.1 histidinol phosphate phosphatase domain-containing protein [Candidatus Omnitrophota bacterium]
MIDLHTHTLFSDGELLPEELVRRAEVAGYQVLGITDHVDTSNIDFVLPRIVKVCRALAGKVNITVIPGVEITHVLPADFYGLVQYARANGACLVIGHGETLSEPVRSGTNLAAIEAGVDILAHPGIIAENEARLAAEKGVSLEISARKGHCLGNGHVVKTALSTGARLVLNSDTHSPDNLITRKQADLIARGAGLEQEQIQEVLRKNIEELAKILITRFSR